GQVGVPPTLGRPRPRHPARPRGPGGDPEVPADGDRPPRVPPGRSGGVAHLPSPRTRRPPRGAPTRHAPAPAGARPDAGTHRRLGRRPRSPGPPRPPPPSVPQPGRGAGGILTEEALARVKPRWRTPLWGSYRGHRIATFPPPSGGGVILLEALGVLERLGPKGLERRHRAHL